jgi:hypothetical protein
MKIVQNYKENILRSASDSTYIFLLKIKNSVWFLYPLPPVYPSKAQYFAVHCSTLYPVTITFHKKIWELQIGVFAIPPSNGSSAV